MKKQLLLILAALLLSTATNARIITPSEGQVWWGYFNESDFEDGDYTIGTGSAMTLMCGIYIPANHEQVGDATIQAVRIYCKGSVTPYLSGLKFWISKSLPNKADDADYSQTALGTLRDGANDFALKTPYEVNNEGFYIGYQVKSTTGYFVRTGGVAAPNSFWIGNPSSGFPWQDLGTDDLGKLAFQILVEGGNFPNNSASVSNFGNKFVLMGETAEVPVTITNNGQNFIENISYTVATDDGDVTPEETVELGSLAYGKVQTISLKFNASEEAKKQKKTFTITKVNGEENNSSRGVATGYLTTLKESKPVTPVIEEFTGTWCGWCPRGMVGMEKIHEAFGDQVVQIAAHYGDPMAINEYQAVINAYTEGFPNSITDRQIEADPSFADLSTALKRSWERVAQGAIELTAEWENSDKNTVNFTTKTNFSYSEDEGDYGIALVLTEDGMTGTENGWAQSNYYSGSSGDSDMSFWYRAGASVSGLKFNHVPVAAWGAMYGISGSVKPKIVVDETQEYSYSADIAKNALIQDKTLLKAVALLIDGKTGVVINAAQADIVEKGTGISTVTSAADGQTERYAIDGRKLSTAEKGINIIRMNDGSVRKVLVK